MEDNKYLKQKVDPERKKKLLEERQDRMLADMRKQASTPINQLENLDSDVRKVKGGTDKINTKEAQKVISGGDFQSKLAALLKSKAGSRALKAIPLVGTGLGLLSAGEAAYAGDMDTVRDELASAADPTGISDVMLLGRDIADSNLDKKQKLGMEQAETKAFSNYMNSPAAMDRKAKLDQILSGAPSQPESQAPAAQPQDMVDQDEADIEELYKSRRPAFNKLRGMMGND